MSMGITTAAPLSDRIDARHLTTISLLLFDSVDEDFPPLNLNLMHHTTQSPFSPDAAVTRAVGVEKSHDTCLSSKQPHALWNHTDRPCNIKFNKHVQTIFFRPIF